MSKKRMDLGEVTPQQTGPNRPAVQCFGRRWAGSGGEAHKFPTACPMTRCIFGGLTGMWTLIKDSQVPSAAIEQTTELTWWRQKEGKNKEAPWNVNNQR